MLPRSAILHTIKTKFRDLAELRQWLNQSQTQKTQEVGVASLKRVPFGSILQPVNLNGVTCTDNRCKITTNPSTKINP